MSSERSPKKKEAPSAAFLRLTGLGLSMVGIILGFTFLGYWLDGLLKFQFPILTLILALVGVVGAMLHLFKETGKKS
jgi:preprotein translocase subunit Sss1